MKCTEIRENLAAYLDGEIEGASRRSMDAHFTGCPACLAEKRAQAAAWRLLDLDEAPAAPVGLGDRILARSLESRRGRVLPFRLRTAAAAAAVLLAAGGAAVYMNRPGADTPAAPPDLLLEDLAMLESLDLLQDEDVTVADSLADYPVEDLEDLGG